MLPSSLTLTLTAEANPGYFTLNCASISTSILFRLEARGKLNDLLRRLPPVLVGGRDPARQLDNVSLLRAIGIELWETLLPETLTVTQRDTLASELLGSTVPLLLSLPHSLASLPWELLYDPQRSDDTGFLARRRPLVRLISSSGNLAPLAPPLKVLLLISSPLRLDDRQRLDVESERAAIENAMQEARQNGLLHLQVEDRVTIRRVQQALVRFRPHILHYIGHGNYEEEVGGALLWENDHGTRWDISDTRLAELLRPRGLRAVLLHGCQTASSDSYSDIRGVARTLLDAGIPAVIAQQANFTYTSSQWASEALYTALTSGQGLAEAIFEVRQALAQGDRPDWAVPTLQSTTAGLAPLFNEEAPPAIPDPTLARSGAALNLPAPTGVFVGRQRELRLLQAMLESTTGEGPVIALISGPAGIGKSTLAARAAIRFGGHYKAALTLSCESYQGLDLFLQRIGEFLKGLGFPGFLEYTLPDPQLTMTSKIESVIQQLNLAGPLLLLVDGLENVQQEDHTITDAHLLLFLQRLLTNLQGGRVLLIGRYAVTGLQPDGKFAANLLQLDLDDLSERETYQLIERHSTLEHIDDTTRNKLVSEFGGLPYFYDLLSRQATKLSPDALIYNARRHITSEREQRASVEWKQLRQQAVEFAALEPIVERLSAQERLLLARLTVFHRPFPLQALERGLGASEQDWQSLIDWGLLRFDQIEGDYRLHSLTAQYAESLLEATDRIAIQKKVAEWYLTYARKESHKLSDYLEAYTFMQEAGELQWADELVVQLSPRLRQLGLYQLARKLLTTTIQTSQGTFAASAQLELGSIVQLQGNYNEARRLYQSSLSVYEQSGDQLGQASALNYLGLAAYELGDYDEARQRYNESLTIYEQLGDQLGRASPLHQLAMLAQDQGDYSKAQALYQECLAIFEQSGDSRRRANSLHQLGMIAQAQGDYSTAQELYNKSLEIEERVGNQQGRAISLYQIGSMAQEQGDDQKARRLYNESLTIREQLGDQRGRALCLHRLGTLAQEQGDYEEARRLFQESLAIEERLGDQGGRATALIHLGEVAQHQEDYTEAQRLYDESLTIFKRMGDLERQAGCLHQLGTLVQEQKRFEEAQRLYSESMAIFKQLGEQKGQAASLHQQGLLAQEQGDYAEARRLYSESIAISERLGYQRYYAISLYQLGKVAQLQEDFREARLRYIACLPIFRQLGDESSCSDSLHGLGEIAYQQKNYGEAQQWYHESLGLDERLNNESGRADSLFHLARMAQEQGDNNQARQQYSESLPIFEWLGELGRCAACLLPLGAIAQDQHDYKSSLQFRLQLLTIFERLNSPHYNFALEEIAGIQAEIGEVAFADLWREVTNGSPMPALPTLSAASAAVIPSGDLLNRLIAVIGADTLGEMQQKLEADPELMSEEADVVLKRFVEEQQDEVARQLLEKYRALLALAREVGVSTAFALLQANQAAQPDDADA